MTWRSRLAGLGRRRAVRWAVAVWGGLATGGALVLAGSLARVPSLVGFGGLVFALAVLGGLAAPLLMDGRRTGPGRARAFKPIYAVVLLGWLLTIPLVAVGNLVHLPWLWLLGPLVSVIALAGSAFAR